MSSTQQAIAFWVTMIGAQIGAFVIFKDLADISQWVVQSPREFTMAVWYNRHLICGVSVALLAIATWLWVRDRHVCSGILFGVLVVFFVVNMYSGMLNVNWMFRPQQEQGTFMSIEDAIPQMERSLAYAHFGKESYASVDDIDVLVIEADNGVFAYSDYYLLQPHVVNAGTVNGKEAVITYCGLTNLGVAYSPVIDDQHLELRAITQLKNNLVLVDENTDEPIQQLWGRMEGQPERRMAEIATFRMPFRSFRELYPDGKVFVNEIAEFSDNPVLAIWDRIVRNGMMLWGVGLQWDNPDKAAFPSIKDYDKRLPMKQLVYTVSVDDDHVAYTKDFIRDHGGLINVSIGGRPVVIVYDAGHDIVAAFFNDDGTPVREVDVFGRTDQGARLTRVNTLKSKLFWFIFAEFYPTADVNRV